jgi:hypothetical protein
MVQVMPDPPNAKHPADTAAAAEHAAPRRGDQVPTGAPGTRTATGAAARSRSSYSGDGVQAGASSDRIPLARSGSTTTNTRVQSLAQVRFRQLSHFTAADVKHPCCTESCASVQAG